MKVIKYIKSLIDMLFMSCCMYISYPFLPTNIWIISERENQAQDNGLAFFKYLTEKHPEINSYYLIEKDYHNISKLKQIGRVLIRGSIKHKVFFLKSDVIATTEKNVIEPWGSNVFYKYFSKVYPKKTRVFLQHGIISMDVSEVYGKKVSHFNLFVASTEKEKRFIEQNFGYDEKEVICTGISRYDQLEYTSCKNGSQKIILYMPTWRRYLMDLSKSDKKYIYQRQQEFTNTKYYKEVSSFINDNRLREMLEQNDFHIIYIMHHGMNAFKKMFKCEHDRVKIYSSEEVNIQEMLKKAKVFITDFSSIHFDSAYIGNINYYYQFDKEEVLKKHGGKSYFNYEENGFGKVVEQKEDLLEEINKALNSEVIRKDIYNKRVEVFFKYKDKMNSERIFNAIIKERQR